MCSLAYKIEINLGCNSGCACDQRTKNCILNRWDHVKGSRHFVLKFPLVLEVCTHDEATKEVDDCFQHSLYRILSVLVRYSIASNTVFMCSLA